MSALAAVLALCLGAPAARAAPGKLTPLQEAGKRVYTVGESTTGAITALIGSDTTLPASAVPCASCHGADGLGRSEGGVVPSPIRWRDLVKPYGHVHDDGRRHPPFDTRSLARSVTEGVDPAGNSLGTAMPRYSMSRADLDALVAYLKVLEDDLDPGVSAGTLRLGTIAPRGGPLGEAGDAVTALLGRWAAELDAAGGLHGRKVALVVERYTPGPGAAVAAARRLLARKGGVFALVAPLAPGEDEALATLAEAEGVVVIGPVTADTPPDPAARRMTFYLLPGLREQARALAIAAVERPGGAAPGADPTAAPVAQAAEPALRVVVVRGTTPGAEPAAAAARAELARLGVAAEELALSGGDDDAERIRALAASGISRVVVAAGGVELSRVAAAATAAGWAPRLLAPGPLAARGAAEAAPGFAGGIVLAYPVLPSDVTAAGAAALSRLAGDTPRAPAAAAAQAQAQASAVLAAEALRRTGRSVSRERLVETLETTFRFAAGTVPPLSFGPGRRVGAAGAHLVRVERDGSFHPERWVAVP